MNGPRLTPQEAVAAVACQVRDLEAHGLGRDKAIRRVGFATRIDAEKVRWCTETAFRASVARGLPSPSGAAAPSLSPPPYDSGRRRSG